MIEKNYERPIYIEHLTAAFKYGGISFIAGAVNHGFFSGMRSIYTAILGVIFFSIGTFLEHRKGQSYNVIKDVISSLTFSIGFGFFTGGLQHFPDSPERSVWVVPLGFILSFFSLYQSRKSVTKKELKLGIATIVCVILICAGLFQVYHEHENTDHHSQEAHEESSHHDH